MTSVSQIIPTYATGGISDQPDELKKPGQVRDCVNAIPDLIGGLSKRNGLEKIDYLSNNCDVGNVGRGGSWFNFTRENPTSRFKEHFIGKVSLAGKVQVWDCSNGNEIAVYNNINEIDPNDAEGINIYDQGICETTEYLQHTVGNLLKFNTVNNFTFIANPEKAVTMSKDNSKRPNEAFIEVTQLAPNREYLLDVDLIDSNDTSKYRTANTISLVSASNFGGDNKDPGCPARLSVNNVFTIDSSFINGDTEDNGQEGLIVKVITDGVQVPRNEGKFYECEYRHQVELINGGRNWSTGDVFKVYQSGTPDKTEDDEPAYYIEVTDTTTIRSSNFASRSFTTKNHFPLSSFSTLWSPLMALGWYMYWDMLDDFGEIWMSEKCSGKLYK